MLQAIVALYLLTVLIGGAVGLCRIVRRDLPLIGAALGQRRRPAPRHTRLPSALPAR